MKSIRNLFLALLLTTTVDTVADNFQYLTISQTGSETSFALSQISKITFSETDMIMTLANGTTQNLPLSSLSKMFFSETGVNAIAKPTATKSKITVANGQLKVDVADGEHVRVYNIKGEEVLSASTPLSMSIDSFGKGIYVVKIGDETKKIMTK